MKKYLILLVLWAGGLAPAFAQSSIAEEILLKQVQNEGQFIKQQLPATEQARTPAMQQENDNVAYLRQSGSGNAVILQQHGAGNVVDLVQQGNGNQYEGYFTGDGNTSLVTQSGDRNRLVQDISADGQTYIISQQGAANELIQVERGTNTLPYKVTQEGNGMHIIIENGGFAPIK